MIKEWRAVATQSSGIIMIATCIYCSWPQLKVFVDNCIHRLGNLLLFCLSEAPSPMQLPPKWAALCHLPSQLFNDLNTPTVNWFGQNYAKREYSSRISLCGFGLIDSAVKWLDVGIHYTGGLWLIVSTCIQGFPVIGQGLGLCGC